MNKPIIDILHAADIQYQIVNYGAGRDRFDEYQIATQRFAAIVAERKPDILVLPGDIFEVYNANGDETKMFSSLLHACLPHVKRIIIVPGNHDLKQRNSLVIEKSEKRAQVDCIQSTVHAINNSKISYYDKTGFYNDDVFPITWAVWSHKCKFSSTKDNPLPYSPYEQGQRPGLDAYPNVIELFHDPVRGCKSFDGNADPVFNEYGITLKAFCSNTIIAGDIHAPSITWFGENNDRLFTYCSSLVQRNYGEGNRYFNEKLIVDGTRQHGFNTIKFDLTKDKAISCEFEHLPNPISRHTIHLTKDFNYDRISMLNIEATAFNRIKLIVEGNVQQYIENETKLIQHLKDKYDCVIEVTYDQSAFDVDVDDDLIESIESIADMDTIMKIAEKYITDIVNKTKTISPEYKERAIEMIKHNLKTEIDKVDVLNNQSKIKLVSAKISNFMSFANDVSIDFGDRSMNKIGGTNGVGKTTIFSFILWMITDLISEYQSARNKNYNYSLYFNDSSELDEVLGQLIFTKNGDTHVLSKKLTRSRNRKGVISGYSMELELQSGALTSTDTTEIIEYLKTQVCTFDELTRSMFVNQATLTKLIKTSTADLNKTILQNIGVDFFDGMLSTYDDLRQHQLSKLSKPSQTVDELIEEKATNKELIEQQELSIQQLESNVKTAQQNLDATSNEISDLRIRLNNVPTLAEIEKDIEQQQTTVSQNNLKIDQKNADIKENDEKLTELNASTIQSDLNAAELLHNDAVHAIELVEQKIASADSVIQSTKEQATNIAKIVKSELSADITQTKLEIAENKESINKYYTAKQKALQDFQDFVKNKAESHAATKEPHTKLIEQLKIDLFDFEKKQIDVCSSRTINDASIKVLEEQISKLQSDSTTVCPTCQQSLPSNKIEEIQSEIESNEIKLAERIEQRNELTETLSKIDESITKTTTKIAETSSIVDKIDKQVSQIEAFASNELSEKYHKQSFDDYNKAKQLHDEAIAENARLAKKYETDQDNLVTAIRADERVVEASAKVKKAIAERNTKDDELVEAKANVNVAIQQLNAIKQRSLTIENLERSSGQHQDDIAKLKDDITRINQEIAVQLNNINKAKENEIINEEIKALSTKLKQQDTELDQQQQSLNSAKFENEGLKTIDKSYDKQIEDAKNYKLVESTLKLYKKMLGTSGLPQYIFAHVIPLFNKHLNELLEDVDFRLQFDQNDLVLYFNDLRRKTKRPVVFISGMESTFSAVALIDVMRRLNNAKQIKEIFIDEISGQMNSGKEVSYQAKNYQSLLVRFIKKISLHSNVYIIDHVLYFGDDARNIEVYPTENGSKVRIKNQ